MSPLEAALRPLARVLNRNIRETTPARELCEKLDGAAIAVRVRNTSLVTWFLVRDDALEIVDAALDFGGMWDARAEDSPLYRSATLISSKRLSAFPDRPMPSSWPATSAAPSSQRRRATSASATCSPDGSDFT